MYGPINSDIYTTRSFEIVKLQDVALQFYCDLWIWKAVEPPIKL